MPGIAKVATRFAASGQIANLFELVPGGARRHPMIVAIVPLKLAFAQCGLADRLAFTL